MSALGDTLRSSEVLPPETIGGHQETCLKGLGGEGGQTCTLGRKKGDFTDARREEQRVELITGLV